MKSIEDLLLNMFHFHKLDIHLHYSDISLCNMMMDKLKDFKNISFINKNKKEINLAFGYDGFDVYVALSNVIKQIFDK